MSAFIRRYTSMPAMDVLTEIEAVNIIDQTPQNVFVGVGSGTVLAVGEYEDGPFAAGSDSPDYVNPTSVAGIAGVSSQSILEIYGDADAKRKFGGFGFTHDGVPYSAPCARQRMGEHWNGNGFLKMRGLRTKRLMVGRVDTSVGTVSFFPLAIVDGTVRNRVALTVGDVIGIDTDQGSGSESVAIAAVVATEIGTGFATSGFVGGEQIRLAFDGGSPVLVVFSASDSTRAQVAAKINLAVGATVASDNGVGITLVGFVKGTAGAVAIEEVTAGALAAIGLTAGTTAGTGNVANLSIVSAAEIAAIINASPALQADGAIATVTPSGSLRVASATTSGGTVQVVAGPIQAAFGLATTSALAGQHDGGVIPAGTRVSDGVGYWVTMQTLTIQSGDSFPGGKNEGPHSVKVRALLDVEGRPGATAATVVYLVDQPAFAAFTVTNPQALTASLTDAQIDNAYGAVFEKSKSIGGPARVANFMLVARRSPTTVFLGRENVEFVSANGCFGRKYVTRSPLGYTADQAIADVASYRSDRVYYTTIPLQLYVPEIAFRGTAGGIGFTANGVIDVGADTALTTLCAMLSPEEDPGQQTDLLKAWLGVSASGVDYSIETYKAFRRAGICAPRSDSFASGLFFQSGVTSSLEEGRTEINRRNMADFVQDSLAILALPYSKKLPSLANKSAFRGDVEAWLNTLQSPERPDASRISAYRVDEKAGNSPDLEAKGVFVLLVKVRTYESMKYIEIPVEIGSAVTITDQI